MTPARSVVAVATRRLVTEEKKSEALSFNQLLMEMATLALKNRLRGSLMVEGATVVAIALAEQSL